MWLDRETLFIYNEVYCKRIRCKYWVLFVNDNVNISHFTARKSKPIAKKSEQSEKWLLYTPSYVPYIAASEYQPNHQFSLMWKFNGCRRIFCEQWLKKFCLMDYVRIFNICAGIIFKKKREILSLHCIVEL